MNTSERNDDPNGVAAAIAKVKASGKTQIIVLTRDERKAMRKAMAKVHKEMADRIGKDLIARVYKETGFNPSE